MGGSGSGRREEKYDYTVEDCRSIDSSRWLREGILKANMRSVGSWAWYTDKTLTEQRASIGYEIDTESDYGHVRLFYTWRETEKLDYQVRLITTPLHFGGRRWWFVCPNTRCGKKVGKLHLAPNSRYFLCRTCQNLTYTSCRDSHKFDSLYARLAADTGVPAWAVRRALRKGLP